MTNKNTEQSAHDAAVEAWANEGHAELLPDGNYRHKWGFVQRGVALMRSRPTAPSEFAGLVERRLKSLRDGLVDVIPVGKDDPDTVKMCVGFFRRMIDNELAGLAKCEPAPAAVCSVQDCNEPVGNRCAKHDRILSAIQSGDRDTVRDASLAEAAQAIVSGHGMTTAEEFVELVDGLREALAAEKGREPVQSESSLTMLMKELKAERDKLRAELADLTRKLELEQSAEKFARERAEKAEASADEKLRELRGWIVSRIYGAKDHSEDRARLDVCNKIINEIDRLLAKPDPVQSREQANGDGTNPTLLAICAILGADVDSVEAQAAMMVEQADRFRPLEIAALDAMGWLQARLAEKRAAPAVANSISECVDRIWSLVSDTAKGRWPCHPPGVESPVEAVVIDQDPVQEAERVATERPDAEGADENHTSVDTAHDDEPLRVVDVKLGLLANAIAYGPIDMGDVSQAFLEVQEVMTAMRDAIAGGKQ